MCVWGGGGEGGQSGPVDQPPDDDLFENDFEGMSKGCTRKTT